LIDVVDNRGRVLTPCRRKVAEREVRLNRAKWIGHNRIRLRFDPFAYRYIRLKVLARDNHICYWCGQPGDTMDHIVPWSKGGRTTMDNCICACSECNGQRGDMPPEQFAHLRGVPVPCPEGVKPVAPLVRLAAPVRLAPPARLVAAAAGGGAVTVAAAEPVRAPRPYAMRDLLDPFVSPIRRAYP
jgi:hypothetical protein